MVTNAWDLLKCLRGHGIVSTLALINIPKRKKSQGDKSDELRDQVMFP